MITRIDHVSVAVKDYKRASEFFAKIFDSVPGASGTNENQGFFWQILSTGDLSRLEILTPSGDNSFLKPFLSDRTHGGVHHITFETSDLAKIKKNLEHYKIPYFGFNDENPSWKELFIHPRDAFGVLIQLAEFKPDDWLNPSLICQPDKRWTAEKTTNGSKLTFQHPGGGKAEINFSRSELKQLICDLKTML